MYRDETKNLVGEYEIELNIVRQQSSSSTYFSASVNYNDFINENNLYKHVVLLNSPNSYTVCTLVEYSKQSDYLDVYYTSIFYNGSTPEVLKCQFNYGNQFFIWYQKIDGTFMIPPSGYDGTKTIKLFN